jgi:hypothetical protein
MLSSSGRAGSICSSIGTPRRLPTLLCLRTEPWDSLKYIPLFVTDPKSYVSLGATLRSGLNRITPQISGPGKSPATLGASLVLGTSGAIAKLLALPVFCMVVFAIRLLSSALLRRKRPALKVILGVKVALLITGAVLAIHFGPRGHMAAKRPANEVNRSLIE